MCPDARSTLVCICFFGLLCLPISLPAHAGRAAPSTPPQARRPEQRDLHADSGCAASAHDGESRKRQELEALRHLLQGGEEALEKTIAREEEFRVETEEREQIRARREKNRRMRADEVSFLRSVAIRNAQVNFGNAVSDTSASIDSAHAPITVRSTDPGAGNVAEVGTNPMQSDDQHSSGQISEDGRREKQASKAKSLQGQGRALGQDSGLAGADVGVDAWDSWQTCEDVGSTLSAQANLHAQEAVERTMQGIEQVLFARTPFPYAPQGAQSHRRFKPA
jgi:hypothetical protein